MSLSGKLKHKLDIPTNFHSKHGELGNVYALDNGNYLAQLWGEGSVIEVDKTGKELWRYQVPNDVKSKHKYPIGVSQDVLRLKNGNTMIACGTQARLLEVNKDKNIVWQLKKDDYPELNMTNACNLIGTCMTTAYQMHGNCMTTAWQMHDNCMTNAWPLQDKCMAHVANCMAHA